MRWRVGILYRAIELLELLDQQPRLEQEILESFRKSRFHSVEITDILDLCYFGKWIQLSGAGELTCTEGGRALLTLESPRIQLREQIKCLIEKDNPQWASSIVQGRQALLRYVPPEVEQCFQEAGLTTGEEEDIVSWWDNLASRYRATNDDELVEVGRQGERYTVELEWKRTQKAPKWVALEFSNAGYDVLSCLSRANPDRLVIEVKTSQKPWQAAQFYLSRAEWNVLCREINAVIHLWSIHTQPPLHSAVSLKILREHIPIDTGDGNWHRCKIPFRAFHPIKPNQLDI